MGLRKFSSLAVKIAFAAAVLTWMTHTDRLNLGQIGAAFRQWPAMVAIVAIIYAQIALMSWRWRVLTNALGFGLHYRKAFSLSLIGLLFTVVLPGSVTGDLVKAYYLGRDVPKRRSQGFTTILIDRYLGLLSLLGIGCVGVLLNLDVISHNRILASLALFAGISFVGGVSALLIAILVSGRVSSWLRRLEERTRLAGVLIRCLSAVDSYRTQPRALIYGFLISIPTHILACTGIYIAMQTVQASGVSLELFLLLVPLGLITTAIPVSPAGVGIGQAAFYSLFSIVAASWGTPASSAFTVFQSVQIAVFLTGFLSYFTWRSVKTEPVIAT